MKMQRQPLRKLTKAYLVKFFRKKDLAYQEWAITTDNISRVVSNYSVIEMICKAKYNEQRELASALYKLEEANRDINMFLKHLAIECNVMESNHDAEEEVLLKVG